MVLIDLWAREMHTPLDCFADITWVGYCGAEPPASARAVFEVVAAGRDAAVRYMQEHMATGATVYGYAAVSYTHLDVYKRQQYSSVKVEHCRTYCPVRDVVYNLAFAKEMEEER